MNEQQEKHEWQSGGTRNPYGSLKKFYDSRSKLIWVSKYQEEDGTWRSQTLNLGRNMLKRTAKALAKKFGFTYSESMRLLKQHIEELEEQQRVQAKVQQEINNE